MATVNFLYRSTKDKAPLILRLLYRHNNVDYVYGAKTKIIVSKHYWTKQHKLKRVSDIEISNKQIEINGEMNKVENHVINAFNKVNNPSSIDKQWLANQIEMFYNPNQIEDDIPTDLVGFLEYYIKVKLDPNKKATIKKYNVLLNKMKRFQKELERTIFISDINEGFQRRFQKYYNEKFYAHNTAQRELNIIKTICRYARIKGIPLHQEFDMLGMKEDIVDDIYLTFDEIEKIKNAQIEEEYLDNARDWLIISCYTGQRISDFMRFDKSMISEQKGVKLIEFMQKKPIKPKYMAIPVFPEVQEILDKRNGEFPRKISDQRYNDYIKIVCEKAGINEMVKGKIRSNISKDENNPLWRDVEGIYPKHDLVTSHIGRKSFASNYHGNLELSYIKYITGHSTEKILMDSYMKKKDAQMGIELYNKLFKK